MREHTHRLEVRLNDREYRKLKELTMRSALPTSTIIRKLIADENIVEHPSVDYWKAYQSIDSFVIPGSALAPHESGENPFRR